MHNLKGKSKATVNFRFCTALLPLLMMTADSMLSKRPVLRFTVALFFLLELLSSHIYCIMRNCFHLDDVSKRLVDDNIHLSGWFTAM